MHDICTDAGSITLFIHNDDDTPVEFVRQLLRNVFGKSEREAIAFTALIENEEKVACGPYPGPVAKALLDSARQSISAAGHGLLITSETAATQGACDLCGAPATGSEILLAGRTACLCNGCLLAVRLASEAVPGDEFKHAWLALDWHFAGIPRNQLVTRARQFPGHMLADVQVAVDQLLASPLHFFGIHEEYRYETLAFAALMKQGRNAPALAPAQYHDVEIGEAQPVKCLHNGLWLCRAGELRYAVLLSFHREYQHEAAIRIEIAVPTGAAGDALVQRSFAELEEAVHAARSYRGKILSLEGGSDYRGRSRGVMVHRLPAVGRDEVILPEQTLKLLDRNVMGFVGNRAALRKLGQSTRKGILLYGPPGTGKTHTIRYLATNLPGHTTLIITAEQVGLLGVYMKLARLLQPTMVVIEDVDLIARDREEMGSCEEPLLNKLLNEMDGLKEDSDILFVLTTNRPEQLEGALAGRPGRIDQAIEVPLPDGIGRSKLVQLYGKELPMDQTIIDETVNRTKGVSAAFIKELMRRIAQASIFRDDGSTVESGDISEALDDMLFTGGRLNVTLLGGAQEMAGS
ncbi:ATP-dependent Clp protease adaptor ClpS [Bradyrhizobium sp. RDI18]|uniref:ATP-dependent Clp protease adaptor ClpS n=1 Tax=Bradyrhizobium sp. RDI18 TaxID=3367400 RepID=UPI00371FC8B7